MYCCYKQLCRMFRRASGTPDKMLSLTDFILLLPMHVLLQLTLNLLICSTCNFREFYWLVAIKIEPATYEYVRRTGFIVTSGCASQHFVQQLAKVLIIKLLIAFNISHIFELGTTGKNLTTPKCVVKFHNLKTAKILSIL